MVDLKECANAHRDGTTVLYTHEVPAFEITFAVVTLCCLAAHGLCCLRAVGGCPSIRGLLALPRFALSWLGRSLALTRVVPSEGKDGPLERAFKDELGIRRTLAAERGVRFVSFSFALQALLCVANVAQGRERWLSLTHDVCFVVGYVLLLLTKLVPSLLGPKSIWFWYLVTMIFATISVTPFALHVDSIHLFLGASALIRYLLGTSVLELRLSVACNTVYSSVLIYTSWGVFGREYSPRFAQLAILELGTLAMISFGLANVQRSVMGDARRKLELATFQSEHYASVQLLNLVCDAVLEIDGDLRIVEDVPKLSVMLHQGKGKSLKGQTFTQFIASDEDKEHFERCMLAGLTSDVPEVQIMHLQIADNLNLSIRAAIFYVHAVCPGNRPYRLLGIQEQGDLAPRDCPLQRLDQVAMPMESVTPWTPHVWRGNEIETPEGSLAGSGSSCSFSSLGDVDRAWVSVDAFSDSLSILSVSDAFASLGSGSSAKAPLLAWIKSPGNQAFVGFVQDSINSGLANCKHGASSGDERDKFGPIAVELRPPDLAMGGSRDGIVYRAQCSVHTDEDMLADLETAGALLVFEDIRLRRTRPGLRPQRRTLSPARFTL